VTAQAVVLLTLRSESSELKGSYVE
jgi:hypothetical protein